MPPLGLAYVVTLLASLFVSLTVTPVLASYLLPNAQFLSHGEPAHSSLAEAAVILRVLHFTLRHAYAVLAVVVVLVVASVVTVFGMGGEFLPPFNEGTLTIDLGTPPSTSLQESDRIGNVGPNGRSWKSPK